MATLIGDGAHARDIAYTLDDRFWHFVKTDQGFDPYDEPYIIGINDPRVRAEIASRYLDNDQAWVHPDAVLGNDVGYGPGTHINYGVHAVRTTIGHHCTISPGVTICGDITIGDRVLVGAGATICDRVTIGNDCTIGAGTIILPESVIGDGETWVGNPARRIK